MPFAAARSRATRSGAGQGERVLDVGCGPGYYCVELLDDVGPGGSVVGVDSSDAMLTLATRRVAGRENVEIRRGDAVALPVADGEFDAALCVQVLEYVADVDAALAELHRALRPGGRLLVWDVDWATLSLNSEDEKLTRRVLGAWDEHLVHPSLPRVLAPRLRNAEFLDVRLQAHPFVTIDLDEDAYGAALLPFIGDFVAGRNRLSEADGQRWVASQRALGSRGAFYFASTQCCFTGRKPG